MAVYVDKMVNHGKVIGRAGPYWCHLLADNVEELHTFARNIGMPRSWFQLRPVPHYDIGSKRLRVAALNADAQEATRREIAEMIRSTRVRR